jgi:hypothetical protein
MFGNQIPFSTDPILPFCRSTKSPIPGGMKSNWPSNAVFVNFHPIQRMAGAHGNRTHQEPVSRPLTGFEDRAGHQPRTHSPMLRELAEVVARLSSDFLASCFSAGAECQAGKPDLREYSCGHSSLALLSYRILRSDKYHPLLRGLADSSTAKFPIASGHCIAPCWKSTSPTAPGIQVAASQSV